MKKLIILITAFFLMISCCIDENDDIIKEETITQTITNTFGKTLYLVKMNPTSKIVSANNSGYINLNTRNFDEPENYTLQNGTDFIRKDNPLAFTFHPKNISISRSMRSFNSAEYDIGNTKEFWIMTNEALTADDIKWEEISATLRTKGNFCNIWVPDKYYKNVGNAVSEATVTKLAEKFDLIYPRVTNVFGYANSNNSPINILIFDLNSDYKNGKTFGYFMPKDYSEYDETYHSNECCIFYLDAYLTETKLKMAYSTLAHEFQHMINYYNKEVCISNSNESYTWFTEMLSMLCEDMLQTFLEINDEDSPIGRMPYFNNGYYKHGITEWQRSQYSYACTYAFGAYLVRNFGGVKLLSAIGKNELINKESITMALQELGYHNETFDSVFLKYAEALIYENSNKFTLNKSITEELNGYEYTFRAFNIWEINNGTYSYFFNPNYGPVYFSPAKTYSVRPYGFTIHTQESWKNISTDTLSVSITKPENSSVKYQFILK